MLLFVGTTWHRGTKRVVRSTQTPTLRNGPASPICVPGGRRRRTAMCAWRGTGGLLRCWSRLQRFLGSVVKKRFRDNGAVRMSRHRQVEEQTLHSQITFYPGWLRGNDSILPHGPDLVLCACHPDIHTHHLPHTPPTRVLSPPPPPKARDISPSSTAAEKTPGRPPHDPRSPCPSRTGWRSTACARRSSLALRASTAR